MSAAPDTTTVGIGGPIPALVADKIYSPEELLALPDGKLFELVDGELVGRNMGAKSSLIASELNRHLGNFVSDHQIGYVWGADCSYQIFGDDANKVRRPDGSFIAKGRLENDEAPEGHVQVAPDLAIEVVSPNDLAVYIEGKVDEYLRAGVRLIWVVYPESKHVLIYRSGTTVKRLGVDDELTGEDILPGFTLAISSIFSAGREPAGE
ncbi:MAG: Uma2 family endonuclease [Planctomycetes bacterium]|nr:Uma2 family endonuclease [Planctomycetota bacterium]